MISYIDATNDNAENWYTVKLPRMRTVTQLTARGKDIFAYATNRQVAVSKNFGLTWSLIRERRKYRRYKRK